MRHLIHADAVSYQTSERIKLIRDRRIGWIPRRYGYFDVEEFIRDMYREGSMGAIAERNRALLCNTKRGRKASVVGARLLARELRRVDRLIRQGKMSLGPGRWRGSKALPQETLDRIRELALQGWTAKRISAELGVKLFTVYAVQLRRFGIRRQQVKATPALIREVLGSPDEHPNSICARLGISTATYYAIIRSYHDAPAETLQGKIVRHRPAVVPTVGYEGMGHTKESRQQMLKRDRDHRTLAANLREVRRMIRQLRSIRGV